MCGALLRQADRLTTEGLHPRVITDGYDIARDATLKFLESFKVSLGEDPLADRDLLRSVASTSLRTKLDRDLADGITEAVVDSICTIAPDDLTKAPLDLNMIEVMTMEQRMGTDSRFVNGLVLDHGGRHPDMPKVLTNCLQDDVTGDGTTSTVLLCGALLRQADRLTTEGLHPRVITDGYDIARDATLKFLESFKVSLGEDPLADRDLLRSVASTSLRTKLDRDLADGITEAVVDSICTIAPDDLTKAPLDLNMIEVMTMEQRMGTDSRFVNGLVLDHGGRHPDMPKVLTNCHIMTCNVTFEYEQTEVQSGFFYSSAEEREKLVESERKWLDERCRQVVEFKRSVCKEGEVSVTLPE